MQDLPNIDFMKAIRSEVLAAIAKDVERDISEFEGKPFTGKNVSTLFGYQAAAIKTLAEILKTHIESTT